MITYETLFMAYEAALRSALLERVDGDRSLVPPTPRDLREADRSIHHCALALYNDFRRRVEPKPRTLHFSDEFQSDSRKADFDPKLSQVLRLLEAGDDAINDPANEYLSRTVEHVFHNRRGEVVRDRATGLPTIFQDYMLYDWGIHHFHIEEGRGKHLLFVMLRGSDAFVLKIGPHGQQFDDPAILDIAHRNWPDLLPQLHAISIEKGFTPKEIKALRKNNVVYALNVGGRVVPPIDARATDGTPVRVTQGRDYVARQLRAVASALETGQDEWVGQVIAAVGGHPDEAMITLHFTPVPMAWSVLLRAGGNGPWAEVGLAGAPR